MSPASTITVVLDVNLARPCGNLALPDASRRAGMDCGAGRPASRTGPAKRSSRS
jgi:hypothetical protein